MVYIWFVCALLCGYGLCFNPGSSWRNYYAFAALKQDGTVAAWGDSRYGGSGVPSGLSGVKAIYSTNMAFAALKQDGTVAAWGSSIYGGSGVPSGLSGVKAIYSTGYAFAALKQDGTVAAWGDSGSGGNNTIPSGLSGVKAIYSTFSAFAALKQDGTVAAWGDSSYGGSGVPSGLSGVKAIYSTDYAFAALKQDGTVAAWGSSPYGGSGVPSGLSGVKAIYSTIFAFAALKQDGTVAAWGDSSYGGSGVPSGLSGVKAIYSTIRAFAALKQDGTVAAWGDSSYGGNNTIPSGLSGVKAIYSTYYAFAALKQDGTVAAWGDSRYGGNNTIPSGLSGVKAIYSTYYAFAALKQDGTVAAWGSSTSGGSGVPSGLSGVKAIYSTYYAFAALKQDGTVAAWGSSSYGGSGVPLNMTNIDIIYGQTLTRAISIYPHDYNLSLSPTVVPTASPTLPRPTAAPTLQPTGQPTRQPSSQPTTQPTTQPSCQPTSAPTQAPTLQATKLFGSCTLAGISMESWSRARARCVAVFQQAAAASMAKYQVEPSQITEISAAPSAFVQEDGLMARGQLRGHSGDLRRLTSDSIDVTFVIMRANTPRSFASVGSMVETWQRSVRNGDLTQNLQRQANEQSLTVLEAVTVQATDVPRPTAAPTPGPPRSGGARGDKSGQVNVALSTTLISAIFGVLWMALMLGYYIYFARAQLETRHDDKKGGDAPLLHKMGVMSVLLTTSMAFLTTASYLSQAAEDFKAGEVGAAAAIIANRAIGTVFGAGVIYSTLGKTYMPYLNVNMMPHSTLWLCVCCVVLLEPSAAAWFPWRASTFTTKSQGFPTFKYFMACTSCSVVQHFWMLGASIYAVVNSSRASSDAQLSEYLSLSLAAVSSVAQVILTVFRLYAGVRSAEVELVSEEELREKDKVLEELRREHEKYLKITAEEFVRGSSGRSSMTLLLPGSARTSLRGPFNANNEDDDASIVDRDHNLHGIEEEEEKEDEGVKEAREEALSENSMLRDSIFSKNLRFPRENIALLKEQLRLAGSAPLEYLPLHEINGELQGLFDLSNQGLPHDEKRLEYLLQCLSLNPEFLAQQAADRRKWEKEVLAYSRSCWHEMRSFIPPNVPNMTINDIIAEGITSNLAKRIVRKKCLWLLRRTKEDIEKFHEVDFLGKYNVLGESLDVVELSALYYWLPKTFGNDPQRNKAKYIASISHILRTMMHDLNAGTLRKNLQRHPAYLEQDIGAYADRDTMYDSGKVVSSRDRPESIRSGTSTVGGAIDPEIDYDTGIELSEIDSTRDTDNKHESASFTSRRDLLQRRLTGALLPEAVETAETNPPPKRPMSLALEKSTDDQSSTSFRRKKTLVGRKLSQHAGIMDEEQATVEVTGNDSFLSRVSQKIRRGSARLSKSNSSNQRKSSSKIKDITAESSDFINPMLKTSVGTEEYIDKIPPQQDAEQKQYISAASGPKNEDTTVAPRRILQIPTKETVTSTETILSPLVNDFETTGQGVL